jgi:hypothetical protein
MPPTCPEEDRDSHNKGVELYCLTKLAPSEAESLNGKLLDTDEQGTLYFVIPAFLPWSANIDDIEADFCGIWATIIKSDLFYFVFSETKMNCTLKPIDCCCCRLAL